MSFTKAFERKIDKLVKQDLANFDHQLTECVSTARQLQAAWSPIEAKLMSRQKAKLATIRNHKAKACYVRDHLTANAELQAECERFIQLYDRLTQPKAA